MEKNVNLGVAKELRRYLEKESDLKVVLTRDNDSYLELADRAEIANSSGGDLFLSLHCNSWFNDGAHGLETYFLSPAQSEPSAANTPSASIATATKPTAPPATSASSATTSKTSNAYRQDQQAARTAANPRFTRHLP